MTATVPIATMLPIDTMTLAEWDEFTWLHDQRVELVHGVRTVSPAESLLNKRVTVRLCTLLDATAPEPWVSAPGIDLTLDPDSPLVRCPDVTLIRNTVDADKGRHDTADVALVVEVVSPYGVERDWITKRGEYARAGIPAYLVIDPQAEVLALYTDPTPEGYNARADDGQVATWLLDGTTITIRLADVLRV
ncbi:MAG: Uma2 family endonuclease [Dermatophilus congolensis]|nr:Uma2 family endonuclease [Dermatophilus congolensis]